MGSYWFKPVLTHFGFNCNTDIKQEREGKLKSSKGRNDKGRELMRRKEIKESAKN